MKTFAKIAIALGAAVILLLAAGGGIHGDGWTNIASQVLVVAPDGLPIPDAEVRTKTREGTEVTIAKTDLCGCAELQVAAGWGSYITLLYASHSARIDNTDYLVHKDGYRAAAIEFPQTRFRWYTVLGVDIGRPRLNIRCALKKQGG